jgi:hypothetical protein
MDRAREEVHEDARRGAVEDRGAPVPAPRATLRTREGSMLTPWDALPIPEDALPLCPFPRMPCPFPRMLCVFVGHPRANSATLPVVLTTPRQSRGRAVPFSEHRNALAAVPWTPRGASRARSGAVRSLVDVRRAHRVSSNGDILCSRVFQGLLAAWCLLTPPAFADDPSGTAAATVATTPGAADPSAAAPSRFEFFPKAPVENGISVGFRTRVSLWNRGLQRPRSIRLDRWLRCRGPFVGEGAGT